MRMILRAAFCVFLVWLLIPYEPDLGLGRPGICSVRLPVDARLLKNRLEIVIERPATAPSLHLHGLCPPWK